jgi:hypothetical protein
MTNYYGGEIITVMSKYIIAKLLNSQITETFIINSEILLILLQFTNFKMHNYKKTCNDKENLSYYANTDHGWSPVITMYKFNISALLHYGKYIST